MSTTGREGQILLHHRGERYSFHNTATVAVQARNASMVQIILNAAVADLVAAALRTIASGTLCAGDSRPQSVPVRANIRRPRGN
ncbi:hypothetical protein RGR602_CH03942 [Rhizobium gallicum bv. gallicum R602sp]|uniref:Uncharacterized protein n=1 Tax=Rhizobium gallicum bv. gallicum R602sp TaxID=1041138 RepID=A0A0B4X551_9HYPH|nr:hypothetical protein RGR602_CH03942 [Rhizobium gallicum bv. gallicum R602sp]